MGWGTSAPTLPSGSSYKKVTAASVTENNVSVTSDIYIARLNQNNVSIRFRLTASEGEYGTYYPPGWAGFRVGSSTKAYGWARSLTVYWTGTLGEAPAYYAVSIGGGDSSSAPFNHNTYASGNATGPAYLTTYTITYKANGASGSDKTQSKTYGHSVTLKSASTYSRAGYALTGWNTAANGSGTHYAPGATYSTNASVTLYAEWTPQNSLILSLSSTAVTLGDIFLQVDRKVSTYYHKARFSSGGTTLFTSAAFATDLTVTVPRSWFNSFPNNASITVTVTVYTYTDSSCTTQVGSTATGTVTLTADADMKPTVSAGWAALAEYNSGAVSGMTGYIKGYSKAQATFDDTKVTHVNNASTAAFSVTYNSETASASPYRTGILVSAGDVSITCTVTDTRGRTASETFTVSVMDYAGPGVTNTGIWRGLSDGTEDDDGTYMRVLASASYTSLDGQNSATLSVATKAAGGSWSAETSITSGTVSILSGFDPDVTYTVRVTVTDALGNTSAYSITIPKRKWAMKFRPTGDGVAFGMKPTADNELQMPEGWKIKIGSYYVGTLYKDVSVTLAANSSVSPFGFYGSKGLSSIIPTGMKIVSATGVDNSTGVVLVQINSNETGIYVYGHSARDVTVRVGFGYVNT